MDGLVERQPDRDGEHGRNSLAYRLGVPVLPEVLAAELHAIVNSSDQPPGLVFDFDAGGDTGTMWTLDNTVQLSHIEQALEAHTPEPPTLTDDVFVAGILSRPDDRPLTSTEISRALRLLLSRTTQE